MKVRKESARQCFECMQSGVGYISDWKFFWYRLDRRQTEFSLQFKKPHAVLDEIHWQMILRKAQVWRK